MAEILLVSRQNADFIRNDYQILKKHSNIAYFQIKFNVQNFIDLFQEIGKADLVIGWFASWGVALSLIISKFCKKKFIVIAGGLDAMWTERDGKIMNLEINGVFEKIQKIISEFVFTYADYVLPVSNAAKSGVLLIAKPKNIKTVYNGVPFVRARKPGKEKIVITVAPIVKMNVKKKGIFNFIKVSKLLPEINFFIIGKYNENSSLYKKLKNIAGTNLHFTGYLDKMQLDQIMNRAKVYCQLSYSESFGYSLTEAMLRKCIPVVTRQTALPEIVGNSGLYVNYGDVKNTAKIIRIALRKSNNFGNRARRRVLQLFTLEKRGKELIDIIKTLN